MHILPVIDILDGNVVRGVAGNRAEYRPIQSRWTGHTHPLDVAEALFHAFQFRRFYVADLDGILKQQPNRDAYRLLVRAGYELLIDAGVREPADIGPMLDSGAAAAIVGLETLRSPELLADMVHRYGSERIVFSLDLKSGAPNLPVDSEWKERDAESIAAAAVSAGATQMIVLDLADVGTGTGGSTEALCRQLLTRHPQLKLTAGGGVRGPEDVRRWAQVGISELLVASALHDGRLSPEDVANR